MGTPEITPSFEQRVREPIFAEDVSILQINTGYRCNLECGHCHVLPVRSERRHAEENDGAMRRGPQ